MKGKATRKKRSKC